VLVGDAQRDALADDLAAGRGGHLDLDPLAGDGAVARLLATSLDRDATVGDERRRLRAGDAEALGDEEVQPPRSVLGGEGVPAGSTAPARGWRPRGRTPPASPRASVRRASDPGMTPAALAAETSSAAILSPVHTTAPAMPSYPQDHLPPLPVMLFRRRGAPAY